MKRFGFPRVDLDKHNTIHPKETWTAICHQIFSTVKAEYLAMEQVFQALGIVLVATLESQKMVQLCVPLGKVTPLIHWGFAICSHSSTKVNTCACVVAVHIIVTIIIITIIIM